MFTKITQRMLSSWRFIAFFSTAIILIISSFFILINQRDVTSNDNYIDNINQLNDNVQMITNCREILQLSKTDIEKSLNSIMMKLMSCEYSLVSKINQVNASLIKQYPLKHLINEHDLK